MRTASVGDRVMHIVTKTTGTVEDFDVDGVTGALLRLRVRPDTATVFDKPKRLTWWVAEKVIRVMP